MSSPAAATPSDPKAAGSAPSPGAGAGAPGGSGAAGGAGAPGAGATAEPPAGAKPAEPGKTQESPKAPPTEPPPPPRINIELKNTLVNEAPRRAVLFSHESGVTIAQSTEIDRARLFVYDKEFVRQTLEELERSRVVVLTGEPNSGKASMACFLAGEMRQDSSLELKRDTLLVQPLPAGVGLNLLPAIGNQIELRERAIVFCDAPEGGNAGVADFLKLLTNDGAHNVGQRLCETNSYLIFTAATDSLTEECRTRIPRRLRPILGALSRELVLRGVELRIDQFRKQATPALAELVTGELVHEIAERAQTMSRAARFIDSHLVAVLRRETTVPKAFDELDDLSSWFRNGAGADLEAWIYALALTVSHSFGRGDDFVPWGEFSVFHEIIRGHVLGWRKPKARDRPLDERRLQAYVGAETKRDATLARDLIGFRDPVAARRLWAVLLENFRSLAGSLVPVLLHLTRHASVSVRMRAAQALGRIGSLDAQTLTARWLADWPHTTGYSQKALAGYLAQGVFSMNDREYRRFLLEALDFYARRDPSSDAPASKGGVLMAVAAYKQIANDDFELAMEKLKAIAEAHLAPTLDLGEELRRLDRRLASLKVVEAEVVRRLLAEFYSVLLEQDDDLAQAVRYAMVAISLNAGLTRILTTLRRWALGTQVMGALVCSWFLQADGIARELTDRTFELVPRGGDQSAVVSCNGMVGLLMDDPKAIEALVRFLQTIYAALVDYFPPDLAAGLIRLIFDLLDEWVRDSVAKPPCRQAMVELAGRLLRSNLRELHERTYDWLSNEDFSSGDMAAFARDARRYSIQTERLAIA